MPSFTLGIGPSMPTLRHRVLLRMDRRCPLWTPHPCKSLLRGLHFTHTRSASPERNRDSHRCPSRLDVEYPPGLFCHREENLKRQAETGNMTCNDMGKSLSPDRYARRATPGHGRCRALLDPTPRAPNTSASRHSTLESTLDRGKHGKTYARNRLRLALSLQQ